MKQIVLFLFLSIIMDGLNAQSITLIPQPQQVALGNGNLLIGPKTVLVSAEDSFLQQAGFLNTYLSTLAGFTLSSANTKPPNTLFISLEKVLASGNPPGSYEMETTPIGITIKAAEPSGIFYGLNNIIQLITLTEKDGAVWASIPMVKIKDFPRFAYRGMMLDVARHFRDIDYIKQFLDQMALLKLNVFHWHLTDDQGWRIEIKKHPRLTEVGAYRDGTIIGHFPGTGNDNERHGGFYTQEQVKEIVQYAAERHITIIPEIEMPGHSSAAIAAYPWLSCFPDEETTIHKHPSEASKLKKGKKVQESWGVYEDVFVPSETTFKLLQDVVDEIVPLFPGKYIHIGGDECPKEAWKKSAFCQQLIRLKELKNEQGLQSYFIKRMEKYINSKGKQIIGWDEILEGGLAPNATVMSWRGEAGGVEAAQQGHDVIMSPTNYAYFDYSQTKKEDSVVIGGYLPLEKVYSYNPMPEALIGTEFERFVKGAQANVWTEYIRSNSKLDYMIFPRIAALSEAVWTKPEHKNWEIFMRKLPSYFSMLEKLDIGYSEALYALQTSIIPNSQKEGVKWQLSSIRPDAKIFYMLPGEDYMKPYLAPVPANKSGIYKAFTEVNGNITDELEQELNLHKGVGSKVVLKNEPASKYPGNGGVFGMVNGAFGSNEVQNPEWLGWEGKDLEAVIDLGKKTALKDLTLHVLESTGSWIYMPKDVVIYVSDDNKNFTLAGIWEDRIFRDDVSNQKRVIHIPFKYNNNSMPVKARYVKVWAKNFGEIPAGMPGAGNRAWLFCEEIEIN